MNPDQLAELEEERAFLMRSLADLEREHAAGDVSDDDYETLRDDYTARAARVLRSIEGGRPASRRATPRRRRSLWPAIAATIVLGGFAGWLLVNNSADRQAGDTITGGIGPAGTDVPTLLARARASLGDDPLTAIQLYDQILVQEPDNIEATTYRGWAALFPAFALEQGPEREVLIASADKFLTRAVAADPSYVDAQCFTAILRFRFQDNAAAAKGPYDRCIAGDLPSSVAVFVDALGNSINEALGAPTTPPQAPTSTSTSG